MLCACYSAMEISPAVSLKRTQGSDQPEVRAFALLALKELQNDGVAMIGHAAFSESFAPAAGWAPL